MSTPSHKVINLDTSKTSKMGYTAKLFSVAGPSLWNNDDEWHECTNVKLFIMSALF